MIVYRNYQLHMQNTRPIKKKTFVCEYLRLSELSAHYYSILIVLCEILSDLDKKKTEYCLIINHERLFYSLKHHQRIHLT